MRVVMRLRNRAGVVLWPDHVGRFGYFEHGFLHEPVATAVERLNRVCFVKYIRPNFTYFGDVQHVRAQPAALTYGYVGSARRPANRPQNTTRSRSVCG